MNSHLLELENLCVRFPSAQGPVDAVRGVSLTLGRERLGIVGESGSGKSLTGRALLRLISSPGSMSADKLLFDGTDLLSASARDMRKLRGARMSMVMQDPRYSLHPVMRVGDQIAEALRCHQRLSRSQVRRQVLDMLEQVRINDPEAVARIYPHQVSGGMGQRVMIAMMLIPRPDILIADEPTSALDVSVQAEVLNLLKRLRVEQNLTYLMVSHSLPVVGFMCERMAVMHNGRIVESCSTETLATGAFKHAYTRELFVASGGNDPS